METKIFFIHGDTYLDHIDDKLDMYGLLAELARSVRKNLEDGETAQALRTLCSYENKANEMYEEWRIPDEYAESGDPDDLAQLMEDELLPVDDEDEGTAEDDDESKSAFVRLLRALANITDNAEDILSVIREFLEVEGEIDCTLDDYEGPENACAE